MTTSTGFSQPFIRQVITAGYLVNWVIWNYANEDIARSDKEYFKDILA